MKNVLPLAYYRNDDVVALARDLIGKVLFTCIDGEITAVVITETEAYNGITDRASHAFGGRRTARTEVMYAAGGTSYVYLCYGMHYLFNIVTGKRDIPQAVLVRGGLPYTGTHCMIQRRNLPDSRMLAPLNGPGILSKALGINKSMNALALTGRTVWLEDRGIHVPDATIVATPRIGVDYAGDDALLPYRFLSNMRK